MRWLSYGIVTTLSLLADLVSKKFFFDDLYPSSQIVLIPGFFQLRPIWNPGVAFGMIPWAKDILLWLLPLLVLLIIFFSYQQRKGPRFDLMCLACILGGAIGNYTDRLVHGQVRDFIDVTFGSFYDFPVFNIADACISCSVFLMLLAGILRERAKTPPVSSSNMHVE